MTKLVAGLATLVLAATPAVAGARTHHVPCGKYKAPHTNCGKHKHKGATHGKQH